MTKEAPSGHEITRRWVNKTERGTYDGFSCACGYAGYVLRGTPATKWTKMRGTLAEQIVWHHNVARALMGLGRPATDTKCPTPTAAVRTVV